ncbi:hypothetical protein [Nostoc favosum]|uniref:Uncharacterized protein n=1 Tax=Nostoc favosum CHAB5714 TaxID=2780399 RepID=A0ABS8IAR3_9NOSO|nr:hypothetical protein [Nostoc favosum]MCC5601269.1 hypothetical protein [Nostoc favosum CHAB5714]
MIQVNIEDFLLFETIDAKLFFRRESLSQFLAAPTFFCNIHFCLLANQTLSVCDRTFIKKLALNIRFLKKCFDCL